MPPSERSKNAEDVIMKNTEVTMALTKAYSQDRDREGWTFFAHITPQVVPNGTQKTSTEVPSQTAMQINSQMFWHLKGFLSERLGGIQSPRVLQDIVSSRIWATKRRNNNRPQRYLLHTGYRLQCQNGAQPNRGILTQGRLFELFQKYWGNDEPIVNVDAGNLRLKNWIADTVQCVLHTLLTQSNSLTVLSFLGTNMIKQRPAQISSNDQLWLIEHPLLKVLH